MLHALSPCFVVAVVSYRRTGQIAWARGLGGGMSCRDSAKLQEVSVVVMADSCVGIGLNCRGSW